MMSCRVNSPAFLFTHLNNSVVALRVTVRYYDLTEAMVRQINKQVKKMAKYIIRELQNSNSSREGVEIEAKDLAAAKRAASKAQCFQGTVMIVESDCGELLSTKKGKVWSDA